MNKLLRQRKLVRLKPAPRDKQPLPSDALDAPGHRHPLPVETTPALQEKRLPPIVAAIGVLLLLLFGVNIAAMLSRTQQHVLDLHATATEQSGMRSTILARESHLVHTRSTATTIASTYPFSTQPVLSDPLTENREEDYGWEADNTHCSFFGHAYHAIDQPSSLYQTCAALHTDFTNFTFAIDMNMQEGDDSAYGGMIFRADTENNRSYVLAITKQGTYTLAVLYNHRQGDALAAGQAPMFHQGLHQTNTLAVVARENQLAFYVNRQLIAKLSNNVYQDGEIGVFTQAGRSETDVAYTHATVWQLS